ncbi:membrane protein UL14 [Human betaherpesvirus 5]|nr:membrane protein UL14 [Human betaherpesvirus 5]
MWSRVVFLRSSETQTGMGGGRLPPLWLPLLIAWSEWGNCCLDAPPVVRSPCLQPVRDRNRERNPGSPQLLPYGDRLEVACIFPAHDWPEVSIRVHLCYWPEIVRSLVVDARSGQVLHNDASCYIAGGRWRFEDGGAAQRLSLSFRLITETAGTYTCVLGNETHSLATETTALVADVHDLRHSDRSCDLAFGSRSQTRYLWTPDPSRLRSINCGWEGERHRVVHYIPGTSGLLPSCEEDERELCVPFISQSIADNNCSRRHRVDGARRRYHLRRDYWLTDPKIGLLAAGSVALTSLCHLLCYWCSESYRRLNTEEENEAAEETAAGEASAVAAAAVSEEEQQRE